MPLTCKDCGKVLEAAETFFKVEDPEDPGSAYMCNACFTKRQKAMKAEQEGS